MAGCILRRFEHESVPEACAAPDDGLSGHGRVGFMFILTAQQDWTTHHKWLIQTRTMMKLTS